MSRARAARLCVPRTKLTFSSGHRYSGGDRGLASLGPGDRIELLGVAWLDDRQREFRRISCRVQGTRRLVRPGGAVVGPFSATS